MWFIKFINYVTMFKKSGGKHSEIFLKVLLLLLTQLRKNRD